MSLGLWREFNWCWWKRRHSSCW